MEELHAIVTGRVQGVGFRATAKYLADELQLKGFARNLDDGGVEICAQGEKKSLELLISRLKAEFGKRIENIDLRHLAPTQTYTGFKIF
jgi:acylphosphatase